VADQDRRQELAEFLRSRRQRVNPGDVGFPTGRHRRTVGLRREEVAVLAGVSPTWYTYLEQGRNIQPSPEVLDSLARVLRLSEDERQYMHVLAYGHRPRPRPTKPAAPIGESIRQLVDIAGRGPYPVYAFDEISDLIAWNQAATEWYTDFAQLAKERCNMMWWLLTSAEARERLVEWEQDARDIVARFRAAAALRPGNPRIRSMIADLRQASPEFTRWWVEHDVAGQRMRSRRLRHPRLGEHTMRLQVMAPTELDTVSVVFHLPDHEAPAGLVDPLPAHAPEEA
jgi:transcriptional regulator with XRE-family HTH domain